MRGGEGRGREGRRWSERDVIVTGRVERYIRSYADHTLLNSSLPIWYSSENCSSFLYKTAWFISTTGSPARSTRLRTSEDSVREDRGEGEEGEVVSEEECEWE